LGTRSATGLAIAGILTPGNRPVELNIFHLCELRVPKRASERPDRASGLAYGELNHSKGNDCPTQDGKKKPSRNSFIPSLHLPDVTGKTLNRRAPSTCG
jgi:hypothetical protein